MSAIVTLKKGEGRTIKAGGAWIYDNEIASILGEFTNGDTVLIKDLTDIRWEKDLSIQIPKLPSAC